MQDDRHRFLLRRSRALTVVLCAIGAALAGLATLSAIAADRSRDVVALVSDDEMSRDALAALEGAFTEVIAEVSPSVVGIRVERAIPLLVGEHVNAERSVVVNGTGCVIDPDGLIATNEHVVQTARKIIVTFHDGESVAAEVLSSDPRADLAVLRVPRDGLQPVRWANWSEVRRGQWTIAIGNPYGLGGDGSASVSTGVLSNLKRQLPGLGREDDRNYSDMIQTTAPINPGHSGGPLFNLRGEVLGIITAVYVRAGADGGVGFAIPTTPDRIALLQRLMRGEAVEYGYLGVGVRDDDTEAYGDVLAGPVITAVEAGGPAERAGLRVGDVLLMIDDEPLEDARHFARLVGSKPAGAEIALAVQRDVREVRVIAQLDRRELLRVGWMRGGALLWRGMKLAELDTDPTRQKEQRVSDGVLVIDLRAGSYAAQSGLKTGDIIASVNGRAVGGLAEFHSGVRGDRGPVRLTLADGRLCTVEP